MNDCIFCKIADKQINANVVFEDSNVMAFRDVNPQAPVHILVIPKKHIERLSAVAEADMSLVTDIHRIIQKIAAQEKRTLSDLVDEMLRTGISRYESSKSRKRSVSLPTFAMGEPVINIADHDRLEEAMGSE